MNSSNDNLRKAAVLLRSVDAETATALLAQLSSEEALALREAVRALGPIDAEEQAEVLNEFRRGRTNSEPVSRGVELSLSTSVQEPSESVKDSRQGGSRFEFLDSAPANALASYLSREHVQTIAVVLSHLAPGRAAEVLAALPRTLQTETMERLSALGETDAEVVNMLERELGEWIRKRGLDGRKRDSRRDAVASILAAADAKTREAIAPKSKSQASLSDRIASFERERMPSAKQTRDEEYRIVKAIAKRDYGVGLIRSATMAVSPTLPVPAATQRIAPSRPHVRFDELIHADGRTLAQLIGAADPTMLALALVGSSDELVERVCGLMPKRIAKSFRRELRRMGPTRLSDVEAAQYAIAELASRQLAERRQGIAAAIG